MFKSGTSNETIPGRVVLSQCRFRFRCKDSTLILVITLIFRTTSVDNILTLHETITSIFEAGFSSVQFVSVNSTTFPSRNAYVFLQVERVNLQSCILCPKAVLEFHCFTKIDNKQTTYKTS